ncbi:precorrin-3B synthase [Acuticoccus sp. MNP-M23]|uniref:precorrin-3B synthase n=1 Tax=Acuticoccus sp. MNP-M23 TaxID=3072793 RepID=UPI0028151693|nr:precorrin-3B synthase [Acuticoccus sp. MNP-M23]WMS43278.1 precorrin-3B synthase [Acuticoccus sp. MNP-M23]
MTIGQSHAPPCPADAPAVPARRRGACPSLAAPMTTGDGLLVRLTPEGGAFTPGELGALADAASAHGNGLLEVSARGNVQIRGVRPETLDGLRDAVDAAGIRPREGVPIDTNPLTASPQDDSALTADPAPLAASLRALLAAETWPRRLGPKVAVVIDGGGRFSLAGLLADVRLDAAENGWQVALAGRRSNAVPLGRGNAEEAVAAAFDTLRLVAAGGPVFRARDLDAADLASLSQRLRPAGPLTAATTAPVGLVPLRCGAAAALALPFGAIDAVALSALAAAGSRALAVHPAAGRRLVFTFNTAAAAKAFLATAAESGLVVDAADRRLGIEVCAGKPACASAFVNTRAIAARLAADLRAPLPGAVHISGCAKGCARPAAPIAELVGTADGPEIRATNPAMADALRAAAAAGETAQ